jgi:hypothetical protein
MSIKSSSASSRLKSDSVACKEVRNNGRAIMSRLSASSVIITKSLETGKTVNGCFVCCNSPSCCAICSVCPCCDYSVYVVKRRESSKYVHIRENSIDKVEVIYYDDPIFSLLRNTTRLCNEFRTCLCGGRGERLQISSTCCFGMGYRGTGLCPCVPICCPQGTVY